MEAVLKIQILLCLLMVLILIISFMVIFHTIGNASHFFNRLEDVIIKESLMRIQYLREEANLRNKKQQEQAEKLRRAKALLRVPLDDDKTAKKSGSTPPKKRKF